MSILGVLIALIIVGVILYVVNRIPMDATIKLIANAIVLILVLIWVLQVFGLLPGHLRLT